MKLNNQNYLLLIREWFNDKIRNTSLCIFVAYFGLLFKNKILLFSLIFTSAAL